MISSRNTCEGLKRSGILLLKRDKYGSGEMDVDKIMETSYPALASGIKEEYTSKLWKPIAASLPSHPRNPGSKGLHRISSNLPRHIVPKLAPSSLHSTTPERYNLVLILALI
jgi:hypothetical protein